MELILPIRTLSAALRLVKPTNKFAPQVVQLSADWNGLRLTVASNEATTSYLVPAKVTDSGGVAVGFKDFAATVKGKGDIALRSLGDTLEAQNGLTSRIPTTTTEGVARELPEEPIATWYTLDADAIADVFPAATTDEARPVLCGVYLNGADVVATDSYRLHIARFTTPYGGPSVLLPKPVITVLAKIGGIGRIGFGETTTVVELGGYVCRFRSDHTSAYPKYDQLIPATTEGTLTFDLAPFSHALAGMSAASKKMSAPVRITAGDPGQLHLTVKMGDNTLEADVPGSLDSTETFAFNGEFLSDLVTNTDATEIKFNSPFKPGVLRGRGARWEQIRLLMPVRVG